MNKNKLFFFSFLSSRYVNIHVKIIWYFHYEGKNHPRFTCKSCVSGFNIFTITWIYWKLASLHTWDLSIRYFIGLYNRGHWFVCLSCGSINSLYPQRAFVLVVSGKRHVVTLLHTVKEMLPSEYFSIWNSQFFFSILFLVNIYSNGILSCISRALNYRGCNWSAPHLESVHSSRQ